MDIVEAVNSRRSIRAFRADPVPQGILKEIMELALRAPSWSNTQPWKFVIVGGTKLEEIRQDFVKRGDEPQAPEIAAPPGFPEPYDTYRRALGKSLFEIRGIGREDKEKRRLWRLQGLQLFGAPCVIYIYTDRAFYLQGDKLNVWPLFDCGCIAENIMLLATKYGLGTIPQIQAVSHPDVLRKVLAIPDSALVVLGIAIGYPDGDDPINKFRSAREPLDKVARWYGFG